MIILALLPLLVIFLLTLKHICISGKIWSLQNRICKLFFSLIIADSYPREEAEGETVCIRLLLKHILTSTLWVFSPQRVVKGELRTTTLYILPPHLINQQCNLGLCAHEMKASSESIDFYCLLDCRSLPQKSAAWRQAVETGTIWTVSHWKAQRHTAAAMLWLL